MACGTPALISRDTALGMPEVAPHVYVSDLDTQIFAGRLRDILANSQELELRRQAVACFAHRHWNWENCVDEYHQIIMQLAS
jgi:glycosyltransferase involved in cell wall biosynthesis